MEPLSLSLFVIPSIIAGLCENIVSSQAGIIFDSTLKTVLDRMRQGRLETNHDIERGVRRAYLYATRYVCQAYLDLQAKRYDRTAQISQRMFNVNHEIGWVSNIINTTTTELRKLESETLIAAMPHAADVARGLLLNPQLAPAHMARIQAVQQEIRTSLSIFRNEEFGFNSLSCPSHLRVMLQDGWQILETQSHIDWFKLLCAFFAQEIKSNTMLRSILNSQILAGLSIADQPLNAAHLQVQLDTMSGKLSDKIEHLAQQMDRQHQEQIDMLHKILEGVLSVKGLSLQQSGSGQAPPPPELDQSINMPLFGRAALIKELSQRIRLQLQLQQPAIIALVGMGGAGKTVLAGAIATQLKAEFPNGQLLVHVRGLEGPLDKAEERVCLAFQLAIKRIQPDTTVPDNLESLVSLYQQILTGQRMLIIADDVLDATQAQLFVPPPGCALIVTTRQYVDLGSEPILLRSLEDKDAIAYLQHYVPDLSEMLASEVTRLCDGLPLALRATLAFLHRPRAERDRYMTRLREEQHRLTYLEKSHSPGFNVPNSIRLSYSLLEQQAPKLLAVLRSLSILPGSFTLDAAQAVARLPELGPHDSGNIDLMILELQNYSLLERLNHGDRYNLHSIVRLSMIEGLRAVPAEYDGAWQRCIAHFCTYVTQIAPMFDSDMQQQALEQIAQDHENVHAALRSAIESHGIDQALELGAHLWKYWELRGWIHVGRTQLNAIIAMIGKQVLVEKSQQEHYAEVLNGAGGLARYQGDYAAAITYHGRSLKVRRQLGDRNAIGRSLANLSWVLIDRSMEGDLDLAQKALMEARQIFQQSGFVLGISAVTNNLGLLAREQGQFIEAEGYFHESIHHYQSISDSAGLAAVTTNLASIYFYTGRASKAMKTYQQAQQLYEGQQNRHGIIAALEGQGWAFLDLDLPECATQVFLQSMRLAHSPDVKATEFIVLCLEGLTDASVGAEDWERAACSLGAAEALRIQHELRRSAIDQSRHEQRETFLRSHPNADQLRQIREAAYHVPEQAVRDLLGE